MLVVETVVQIPRQYTSGKPIKAITRGTCGCRGGLVHMAGRKLITTLYAMFRNTGETSPSPVLRSMMATSNDKGDITSSANAERRTSSTLCMHHILASR